MHKLCWGGKKYTGCSRPFDVNMASCCTCTCQKGQASADSVVLLLTYQTRFKGPRALVWCCIDDVNKTNRRLQTHFCWQPFGTA